VAGGVASAQHGVSGWHGYQLHNGSEEKKRLVGISEYRRKSAYAKKDACEKRKSSIGIVISTNENGGRRNDGGVCGHR